MDQIKSPLALHTLPAGVKTCVFHGYGDWFHALANGTHEFFTKLSQKLVDEGIRPYLTEGNSRASRALLAEPHLHIIVGGPAMFGPTILHAHPGYIWGFWYFDEIGHGWQSSLRFAQFCPAGADRESAEYFFNGVTGYMLRENVSISPQEARMDAPLQPAYASIFCQNEDTSGACHYLDTKTIVATTAEMAGEELVYVKPHPDMSRAARQRLQSLAAQWPNIKLSEASVHDLNEAARVVVTQNSTVGFEALMQRKPVITCAKSDYWHATLTPRTVEDLRAALEFGPENLAGFAYESYFQWFLEQHCLEPAKDEFADRAFARIREKLLLHPAAK